MVFDHHQEAVAEAVYDVTTPASPHLMVAAGEAGEVVMEDFPILVPSGPLQDSSVSWEESGDLRVVSSSRGGPRHVDYQPPS